MSRRSSRLMCRAAAVGILAAAIAIAMPVAAQAHVRVLSYQSAVQGGFAALTFRVPTEENSPTVKVEVTMPTDTPLAFVSTMPKAGWSITTEKVTLKTPIESDDGNVTEAISKITWTATAGGIPPSSYDEFNVSVGPLPKVASLSFPAVQTYGTGDVVRWIEPTPPGGTEPDHPVPSLTLAAASGESTASTASSSDDTARGLGIAGLAVGALGLVVAGVSLATRRSES